MNLQGTHFRASFFCPQLDSWIMNSRFGSEILTLTSALKSALAARLMEMMTCRPVHRSRVLALFNFMAELCWANYISTSEPAREKKHRQWFLLFTFFWRWIKK